MKSNSDIRKKRPNHLLRVLILISLGIHVLILLHITGLYKSNTLNYIEMGLRKEGKSPGRALPRKPQLINEESGKSSKENVYNAAPSELPDADPINIDSEYGGYGGFSTGSGKGGGQGTGEDYRELVKRRIEKNGLL